MKYLVTGGAGFIGSHLIDKIVLNGDKAIVIDNFSSSSINNLRRHIDSPEVDLVVGSVLDEYLVDYAVQKSDIVFHMAASVGVKKILENPIESMKNNIYGTDVILSKAKKYNKKIIVASSSEVYGKNEEIPYKEDSNRVLGSPLTIRWSYSESKAIEESLAYAYWDRNGLPIIITRLFNSVGPRQTGHYGMVIPTLISQAINNETLSVYGTGKQERSFCHVSDVVSALLMLSENELAIGKVFNIGSPNSISINDLAYSIIKQTNSKSKIRHIEYSEAYGNGFEDVQKRVPDISKISQLIGWMPQKSLNDIINDIAIEMRENV